MQRPFPSDPPILLDTCLFLAAQSWLLECFSRKSLRRFSGFPQLRCPPVSSRTIFRFRDSHFPSRWQFRQSSPVVPFSQIFWSPSQAPPPLNFFDTPLSPPTLGLVFPLAYFSMALRVPNPHISYDEHFNCFSRMGFTAFSPSSFSKWSMSFFLLPLRTGQFMVFHLSFPQRAPRLFLSVLVSLPVLSPLSIFLRCAPIVPHVPSPPTFFQFSPPPCQK